LENCSKLANNLLCREFLASIFNSVSQRSFLPFHRHKKHLRQSLKGHSEYSIPRRKVFL